MRSTLAAIFSPITLVAMTLGAGCAHSGREKGAKGEVVTVTATDEAVGKAFAGKRLALVVGINSVEDDRWRTLKYAAKDAADLSAMLKDPAHGGYDSVVVLTSKEETTRDRLVAAIRELGAKATHPEDVLVLYLSAHGTLARDGMGSLKRYLVTSDADFRRVAETALPVDDLAPLLKSSASRRRVIFLATCHSGNGKSLLSSDVEAEVALLKGPSLVRPLEEASRASLVFSASDWGETAREDDTLENDVYTHFLVEALGGPGDRNGDGAVTATEAHDFARRRTWVFSQGRQRPSAEILEVGADPVILSGRLQRTGQPELYSYAPRLDGFTLLVDGQERAELPGGVAIPSGDHHVELTKGDSLLLREDIQLDIGQRLDLEDLVRRHEPGNSISLIGGGLTFADPASRAQIWPGGTLFGVSIRSDHVLLRHIGLEADISGGGGIGQITPQIAPPNPDSTSTAAPIPLAWAAVQVGGAALLTWEWRWLSLWGGPRVTAFWLNWSFNLQAYKGPQWIFTATPGLMVGGAIRVSSRLELLFNLQGVLAAFPVTDPHGVTNTRLFGTVGGFAGVGYRY